MDLDNRNRTSRRQEAGEQENPSATGHAASRPLFGDASDRAPRNDSTQNDPTRNDTAGKGIARNDLARNEEKARDAALDAASSNVTVDIYDQVYHLRGPDPQYLEQLSALVDAKMRAVAQYGATVDSLRVAVLAALNLADELVTLRHRQDSLAGTMARSIQTRTETLAEMLDAALESNRKAG